jgi:hypothetical protein
MNRMPPGEPSLAGRETTSTHFRSFAPPRGITLLADGASAAELADAARRAGLAFLRGVAAGWGKRELAEWLLGAYAEVTRHHPSGERVVWPDASERQPIPAACIEELLERAHEEVLTGLATMIRAGEQAVAQEMRGWLVARVLDGNDEMAWMPIDARGARLKDRVLSLFAVDYLHRPDDYACLPPCSACGAILLDEAARELGHCVEHRRESRLEFCGEERDGTAATLREIEDFLRAVGVRS